MNSAPKDFVVKYLKGIYSDKSRVIFDTKTIKDLADDERMLFDIDVFHPQEVFMVELDDSYLCGIRSNHFIVETGWSENDDGSRPDSRYILISGNHKGIRVMTLMKE